MAFCGSKLISLIITTFLIVVAIIGKVATGWAVFGQAGINRLAVDVGIIPRGEVGLVFAGIGSTYYQLPILFPVGIGKAS